MKTEIVTAPNPILKQKAQPVEQVDDSIRTFMDSMLKTMYENSGVGLAANQVSVLKRVIVIDLQDEKDKNEGNFYPLFIANPEIIDKSAELVEADEGCLSVPGQTIMVSRSYSIKLRYLDYNNKTCLQGVKLIGCQKNLYFSMICRHLQ